MKKRQRRACQAIKDLIALVGFERTAAIWETPDLLLRKSRGTARPSRTDGKLAVILLAHPELIAEVL